MECGHVEERLSEYVERTLPHEEMLQVAEHLQECPRCPALMEEMRSILVTCQAYPSHEVDTALLDRILLRTSGRPRTRTLRERIKGYFLQPVLTPRFAMSVGLIVLLGALAVDMMSPHANTVASVLSGKTLLSQLDRGVQQVYSEGLKLYNKKNEWQAELSDIKNNVFGNLGFLIEKLDVPVEGKKNPADKKQQDKNSGPKSSVLLSRA